MTIPKKIWQTYSSELKDIPEYIEQMRKSWIDLNPDWEYNYMSKSQCVQFLTNHYGLDRARAYLMLPHGALQGDFWRWHCLAINGGVYSDIDVFCLKPLTSWIDLSKNFIALKGNNGGDYTFCSWFFAVEKNSSLLTSIADEVYQSVINCPVTSDNLYCNATIDNTYFPFVNKLASIENSLNFSVNFQVINEPFLHSVDNMDLFHHVSASWSHSENDSNFREIPESFYWDCGINVDLKIYNTAYSSTSYPGKFGRD